MTTDRGDCLVKALMSLGTNWPLKGLTIRLFLGTETMWYLLPNLCLIMSSRFRAPLGSRSQIQPFFLIQKEHFENTTA